jgi:hypothetical protein
MPTYTQQQNDIYAQIPKRYNVLGTKYLLAILNAIAAGDAQTEANIEAVRDQSLAPTANGTWLDRRAALYGVSRGQTGILDPAFQQIIPLLAYTPKQITQTLNKLIDVVYGPYSTHANLTTALPPPYNIVATDTLVFSVEGGALITITFSSSDADNLSAMTAQELATAINVKGQGRVLATVSTNILSGLDYVIAQTAALGAQGFLACVGGNAQNRLQFPDVRPILTGTATWNVTRGKGAQMVYTLADGQNPALIAAGVLVTDLVNIRTDSGFSSANSGTFPLVTYGSNFFTILNPTGLPQSDVTTNHADDLCFFSGRSANILWAQNPAGVVEVDSLAPSILLPAQCPIVLKTLKGSAHLHMGLTTASLPEVTESPDAQPFFVLQDTATSTLFELFINNGTMGISEGGLSPQNLILQDTVADTLFQVVITNGALSIIEVDSGTPIEVALIDESTTQAYFLQITNGSFNLAPVPPTTLELTLGNASEFPTSGYIRPVISRQNSTGIINSVTSTTMSLLNASGWPSSGSFWNASQRQFFQYSGLGGNTLTGVQPTPPQAMVGQEAEYVPFWSYDGIVDGVLQNIYPNPTPLGGLEIVPCGATIYSNWPGSFTFDCVNPPGSTAPTWALPNGYEPGQAPFVAAAVATTLGQPIQVGSNRTLVQVGNVTDFPATGGYVVFEFGTHNQEGPVAYLGTSGSTGLILSPSYTFELNHPSGVEVRLVRNIGPYTPNPNGQDYPFYATSTAPMRDQLETYIRGATALGVLPDYVVNVPAQKWPLPVSLYSVDPNSLNL